VAPVLLYRNREAGALLEREHRDRLQAAALLSKAERVARRFLDEAGVTEPPISPYEVARMHGLLVTEQAAKGCDGCVLIEGDSAAVLVNAAIESEERRRFTVAHELGHVALHGDLLQFRREALDEIERETDSGIEAEANAFASELLMPAEFVDREFARQVPSFSVAEGMQTRFRVSFTAAALRLVKRSHHSCALVFTKDGTVVWVARSPEWRRYYVPTGTTPHEGTVTAGLLQGDEPARKRYPTLASYWAPDHTADDDAVVVEEVRRGHAGSILTLLYDQDA
jgi:Zn-dependent peptidase ImmA (M78 family)